MSSTVPAPAPDTPPAPAVPPPPPLDHAAVGNGRVLALVSPSSAIEWLCLPRFDSPSVFARLLDREKGGVFRVLAGGQELTGLLSYLRNTNVARCVFQNGDARWEVIDFAPRLPRGLRRGDFVLTSPVFLVLSYGRRDSAPTLASLQHDLEVTTTAWRQWAKTCSLPTFAAEAVLRSALHLKLHEYHDTGAITAAATSSIPEAMGTPRTWDNRYCWVRDAAFVIEALRRLSHLTEGEQFLRYSGRVEGGPLQPVSGIGGDRDLDEVLLPHLAGFGGNGYVRIGNAAARQTQNDLMGEIVLCLETLLTDPRIAYEEPRSYLPLLERLVEQAIRSSAQPDTGLWEFRTMLREYTFSRAMCWVPAHRGALLARQLGAEPLAKRWERFAAEEREIILRRGYYSRGGYFAQSLDGEAPDASNLLLPTLGLLEPTDPRYRSTVEAYQRLHTVNGLTLRYRNRDDFGETTSAFTICSFWHAEALALTGRLDEAVALFRRLLPIANPVGLLSEDVDPSTGALLGNFPQAYTHVGLIHAAMTLGELLEAREGRVRAWT